MLEILTHGGDARFHLLSAPLHYDMMPDIAFSNVGPLSAISYCDRYTILERGVCDCYNYRIKCSGKKQPQMAKAHYKKYETL